jgi:surface polysaccharide O-acyltransferase-like enzyme
MSEKVRDSNIELLRLVAMFGIVLDHFSQLMNSSLGINIFVLNVFANCGRVFTGIFFVITGYFLAKSKNYFISRQKILKLTCPVWFYSLAILFFVAIFDRQMIHKDNFIYSVFPLVFFSYWFVSLYLIYYLISPLLKKLFDILSNNQILYVFLVINCLFFIQEIMRLITNIEPRAIQLDGVYAQHFYFISYVLTGVLIYRFENFFNKHIKSIVIIFVVFLCLFIFLPIVFSIFSHNFIENRLYFFNKPFNMLYDSSSIFVIVLSICVFILFKQIRIQNKLINGLSTHVFEVYIISFNIFLYNEYLEKFFKSLGSHLLSHSNLYIIIFTIIFSVISFFACIFIDIIKKYGVQSIKALPFFRKKV